MRHGFRARRTPRAAQRDCVYCLTPPPDWKMSVGPVLPDHQQAYKMARFIRTIPTRMYRGEKGPEFWNPK